MAGLLPLALAGCCPGYRNGLHPHAHTTHEPTVLENAQQAVDDAGAALDNLDERLENTIW